MKKVKIVIWLMAIFFLQNWACRTDHVHVTVYHLRDLEPMGSFDGNSIDDENKGKYFISEILIFWFGKKWLIFLFSVWKIGTPMETEPKTEVKSPFGDPARAFEYVKALGPTKKR